MVFLLKNIMEKMSHFLDHIYDNFTSQDKYICTVASLTGWFLGMHLFNPLFIGAFMSAVMSIVIASVTALAGAVTLDFYKEKIKPKLFKKYTNGKQRNKKGAA